MNTRRLGAIAAAIVAVLIVLAIINPFRTVSSGHVGVLTRFGSVAQLPLNPGLHFIMPLYESVQSISTQPQTAKSEETASTHDLQNVNTSIAVTFHIDPPAAPQFYQAFRDFSTVDARIIAPSVSNELKAVTANYDAEELVTKRDAVNARIKELIAQSLAPYHLVVEAVNVANFAFSQAYEEAIEQKQVAQQQALQAQYTLQQTQITAQQQVVQAKAAADAAIAQASGQARAILLRAESQAKANQMLNSSLTPSVLQAKALDKWSGTLPAYLSAGVPLPLIGSFGEAAQSPR